jgi:uncharacterized protein (TIGR02271 family)
MSEHSAIAAYFPTRTAAESAIDALEAAGFQKTQIGVAAADGSAGQTTDAAANTAYSAGHQAGSAWNKIKNFFGGNTAEPYTGAAGSETSNDNVVAPETYDTEDLHGSLGGLSVRDEHRHYFGHLLGSSPQGAIVTVDGTGREMEAKEILEENGGDLGVDAALYDYGQGHSLDGTQNIQLYGEVLRVHKDRVSSGEVRLRKEVHTTTQQVEVPVTREELVLERVPDSCKAWASGAAFKSDEILIALHEERAVVTKEPVVREEVRVGKKEISSVETFDEQVRHEELNVEKGAEVKGKAV